MTRIRVVIADDHPLFQDGLARAIREWPELQLVAEASDGRAALEAIRSERPDVAVIDVRLPGLDGLRVLAAVVREEIPTKVMLLSAFTESDLVYQAVVDGAAAYLYKNTGRREICEAIMAVARGRTIFSPEVHGGLAEEVRSRAPRSGPSLSKREAEIITLVSQGSSAPAIARHLGVSPATVKTHLQNLYEKLGVADRAAAVAEAMRLGLLA